MTERRPNPNEDDDRHDIEMARWLLAVLYANHTGITPAYARQRYIGDIQPAGIWIALAKFAVELFRAFYIEPFARMVAEGLERVEREKGKTDAEGGAGPGRRPHGGEEPGDDHGDPS